MLEKHNSVEISAAQLASMVETLRKEDQVEAAKKFIGNVDMVEPFTATVTIRVPFHYDII